MKDSLMKSNIRIFVFGTLRKGGRLDYYMEGSEFLGYYYTQGQLMESPTGSAYVDFSEKTQATIGELYHINFYCLQRIDHLESNWGEFPKGYELGIIPIWPLNQNKDYQFDAENSEEALVYMKKEAKKVRSGDWQNRKNTLEEIGRMLKEAEGKISADKLLNGIDAYFKSV